MEQDNDKIISKISTAINVEQIKSSTNQNISKSRSQVPQMRTVRIQGSRGDMFLRFTSAPGIVGKIILIIMNRVEDALSRHQISMMIMDCLCMSILSHSLGLHLILLLPLLLLMNVFLKVRIGLPMNSGQGQVQN